MTNVLKGNLVPLRGVSETRYQIADLARGWMDGGKTEQSQFGRTAEVVTDLYTLPL